MEPESFKQALVTIIDAMEQPVSTDAQTTDNLALLLAGMFGEELRGQSDPAKMAEAAIVVDLATRILRNPRASKFAADIIEKTRRIVADAEAQR